VITLGVKWHRAVPVTVPADRGSRDLGQKPAGDKRCGLGTSAVDQPVTQRVVLKVIGRRSFTNFYDILITR